MTRCQEVTEQDLRVKDPEPEEVGEWDAEGVEVVWAATVQEQDPWGIACVPPAEPKSPIQEALHVMMWNVPNAGARW
ncbi:MAG: hypothetical protein WBF13_00430 [Candidatus Zixiibacteriota bacterium]